MFCYILLRGLLKTGLPDKWSQWDQVELVPVLSDECSGCAVGSGTPGDSVLSLMDALETFVTPQTCIQKSKCHVLQMHGRGALFGESVAS